MTAGFAIEDALGLDAFEALPPAQRLARLLPVDAPLADLPRLDLDATAARDLMQGREVSTPAAAGRYRAYGPESCFLGLVEGTAGRLRAVRLVATQARAGHTWPDDADADV